MVARYSDATKLKQAKFLAREGGCFVVEKQEARKHSWHPEIRTFWLVYRQAEPHNVFVGKRSSINGLLSLVKKVTKVE